MVMDTVGETEQRLITAEVKFDELTSITDGSKPCSRNLKAIFRHIQKLGQTRSQNYREYIGADLLRKPWRGQMLSRAEFIARSARQLVRGKGPDDCKFPASLQLRSEIMARISVEVECEICRCRFWHSERGTLPETLSSEYLEAIEALQATRPACTCNPSAGNDEDEDHELYLLQLEDLLDNEENDIGSRVKSMRNIKALRQACYIHIPNKRLLQSKIGFFSINMPFLAIVSASEDGGSNQPTDPKFQIHEACPFLLSQEGLRQDAGETTTWQAGPLSWQISHRGNLWSVTAYYLGDHDTYSCCTHILPLWQGCIESVDEALQLLLIVDYIIDWGREIYRPAIVNSLLRASELEAKPMVHTIRTSTRFNKAGPQSSTAPIAPKASAIDPLRKYDNISGVVRDARFVKSLFAALYVTEDNYGILMGSLAPQKRKSVAESILKCLTEAWRVSKDALDSLEWSWTNKNREDADQYPKDKIFLVVVSVTAYLTTSWEPTRELGYLAVAESLLDRLLETANLQHHPGRTPAGFPMVRASVMVMFSLLKQCTIQDTLKACVARKCYQTGIEALMCGQPENERPHNFQIFISEMTAEGMKHRLDVVIKPVSVPRVQAIVFELLNGHMVEVSSSLFRVSSLLEEVPRPGEALDYPDPPTGDECAWNIPPKLPDFDEKNVVLATAADSAKTGAAGNEICMFIIDSTVLEDGVPLASLLDTRPYWHLRVKRFNRKNAWGSRDGNLSDFICRDRSLEPDLVEYREHLRSTDLCSASVVGPGSANNEGFWAPKEFTKSIAVVTNPKACKNFDFMDALRFAEAMPRRKVSSMIWRNPPRNAKTVMTVPIKVDSKGNPVLPGGSKTRGTRREGDAPENRSEESVAFGIDANTSSHLHESEQGTVSLQDVRTGGTVVVVDDENEEAEASSSKGKRPLWDGLPEHDISGPSSKRLRLLETHELPVDSLSDVDFDRLLKAGAFG